MTYLAVDENGTEWIYDCEVERIPLLDGSYWGPVNEVDYPNYVKLPNGTIEKLIGRKMYWKDEPIQII